MQSRPSIPLLTISALALLLAGCTGPAGDPEIYGTSTGGTLVDGTIKQAGSSTVLPIAEVWAEDFGLTRGVQITVAGGGSGAGATGLCAGDLDIGDMSRQMQEPEKQTCRSNGIDPLEWKVAFDGLSVVVSRDNDFVHDLSIEQLAHVFRADDPALRWDQVDESYPDQPVRLCYPDADSGTYEYFNEEILDEGQPRTGQGVQQNPDDNVLVRCLQDDAYAIGYFGFAYLLANEDTLRPVAVEGVTPSFQTIADGTYHPLGRPIYMYTNGVPSGLLGDYFHYGFHPEGGQAHIRDAGYVELDEGTRMAMMQQLEG